MPSTTPPTSARPGASTAAVLDAPSATLPKRALYLTVAGLMLTLLLAALDQTIVGTAMPRVISDLHGFEHYAWVTTAYLLTSTTVVPIVGKLSDMYGRRWFLLGGAAFFILASALCGLAQDMTQLIVFRGLQGFGGGVLTATVFTVISTLFAPAERARMQGLFSGVFALSSIVGPLLGGYLTDNLSWRWVFYVNLPIGLIALAVLFTFYRDLGPHRTARSIDYLGAFTLTAAIVPLLLALSWGGQQYPWDSMPIVGLFAFAAVMFGVFVWAEQHVAEPILPFSLFKNRTVTISAIGLTIMGISMFGTILYIPLFIQGVIGSSATQSGTVLTPMMFAMIGSSVLSGQLIARTGKYKVMSVAGLSVGALGMFLMAGMGPDTDYLTVVRNMVMIGLGLGPVMPVFTLTTQTAVRVDQIGVATSLTQFARSMGATLGTALFGTLLINRFQPGLQHALPPELAVMPADQLAQFQNPQALLNPAAAEAIRQGLAQLGPQGLSLYDGLLGAIRVALASSLHDVFLAGACVAALGVVNVLFIHEVPLRQSYRPRQEVVAPEAATEAAAVAALPPLTAEHEPVLAGQSKGPERAA
ncbi:MAG TPA: MDR family MFS transporter [Chloroflexota bacterium]